MSEQSKIKSESVTKTINKNTKILATLGPATDSKEKIIELSIQALELSPFGLRFAEIKRYVQTHLDSSIKQCITTKVAAKPHHLGFTTSARQDGGTAGGCLIAARSAVTLHLLSRPEQSESRPPTPCLGGKPNACLSSASPT